MTVKSVRFFFFVLMTCLVSLPAEAAAKKAKTVPGPRHPDSSLVPKVDGPIGWGIFQTMHRDVIESQGIDANIDSPYLFGAETDFRWGELEPKEGEYHWEPIDRFIAPWAAAGKKVTIQISTCQKQVMYATPQWVYEAGAKKILSKAPDLRENVAQAKVENNPSLIRTKSFPESYYPIYWDPIYLEKYSQFIRAFGKRYNGHPAVESIIMGMGHDTGITVIPNNSSPDLTDQYRQAGFTYDVWLKTILQIASIYREAFPNTPLRATISPIEKKTDPETRVIQLTRYCEALAAHGVIPFYHNVEGTQKYRDSFVPPLFAKLGEHHKVALGMDNPTWRANQKGGHGNVYYGSPQEQYENAVGGIRGVPVSHLSYFVIYANDVAASIPKNERYNPEYEKSMKWLYESLKQNAASPKTP